MKLAITLDRDESGMIVAECPAIPGCVSQGRTEDEALANIREADVVLVAAAWSLDRRLVWVAVIAFTAWTVPHAVFHVTHLDGFTSLDATLQTLGFALQLGVTAAVVAVLIRSARHPGDTAGEVADLTRRGTG